ncbi:Lon protease [Georgfuchsia toluolica]|uniref:Lon protease n=1 Tax=Georgfuchsia toluolica TaxID=424218 RepID=A0A916MZ80_9PROT|nr:endopeptidase La [Georgfuchsia toluolica]CAG4882664.1 Lon protease [Georgfuchsia toluolica]
MPLHDRLAGAETHRIPSQVEGNTPPQQTEGASAPQDGTRKSRPLPEDALAILPVRNMVLFPGTVVPLSIGRSRSRAAAQLAMHTQHPLGVLLQRQGDNDEPGPDDLHWVGTTARIMRYVTAPDGTHHLICQGEERFRVLEFLEGYDFLAARVQRIADSTQADKEIEARALSLRQRAIEILQLQPEQVPEEMINGLQSIESPSRLADLVAGLMDAGIEEKQSLLETFNLRTRLDRLLDILSRRAEVLRLSHEIDERTKQSIGEKGREHMLREQMRTIQQELGEGDENAAELEEVAKAITDAGMPEEVEKQARKELKRLQRMPEAAGEYSMVRTYLDWLIELPWKSPDAPAIDINEARRTLDHDHHGLDKIKKRILEYIAVKKLNPTGKAPILCFVGPPGVGKTSLGQSIARATGREFVRVSLGGTHDEAEIRGHRRTYIGALPGNIIQGMKKAGTRNCLMMLDEVDKLGMGGFQGDPSSALLEVLDPEQNSTFRDNYLAVPYDLSAVMFICTANVLDTIPGPLRDRMEVIHLPGYTAQEKLQIARRYLLARQLSRNGLQPAQCEITDAALLSIIEDYTREAGVRNLEREIGSVCRHVALRIAELADNSGTERINVDVAELPVILGPHQFEAEIAMRTAVPGVATGLAWTPVGGDILFIEAARMPGSGKLILTGQLGDVMKESAQAALSLIKARAAELGLDAGLLGKSDIHVHVPAGATPKDGPSAGVAMFTALASLLTQRPVRSDVAMTGEISLRGLVLPIGGVKEKVLAALRAGIKTVLLPARNRKDLEDIPAEAREKLEFLWLEHVDDALTVALSKDG